MEPLLHDGDLIVTRVESSYQLGDLVVFEEQGVPVIHRIVGGSATTGWITRGDNNHANDPWVVANSSIAAASAFHVPRLGRVLAWGHANGVPLALAAGVLILLPVVARRRLYEGRTAAT